MKILLLALTLSFTSVISAQIKSGKLIYQMHTESDEPDEYQSQARFIIKFNEKQIWYGKEDDGKNYSEWALEDKISGMRTTCYKDDLEKYVTFSIENPLSEEEEQQIENDYYDDEEEEPNLDTYHEDYYKDLMKFKIPVKDTIIEQTDETKEILGLMCKKTILKIRGRVTMTVWYTTEIVGLDIFNLGHVINGTILSYLSEDEYGSYHIDAVELDKTDVLNEKDLYVIPKDYTLRLNAIYLGNYTEDDEEQTEIKRRLELPESINFPSSVETAKKIIAEIKKSIHFKEDDYPYANVKATIIIDEKGTISTVEFDEDDDSMAAKNTFDKNQLAKDIKRNCSPKTSITLDGKAVSVSMIIDYSFYKDDY